jgi:manganese efflux pump family protein
MAVAALIAWIITALGGFYLLATWISKGGHRASEGSRFPPPVIFGHFALAATGLIVWIIYVATDADAWAWIALVILALVAVLGFTMLVAWLPTYRAGGVQTAVSSGPAERHFPVAVVGLHGLLAVTTVVLVLLTALGVGES